ncbi:MAG: HRDC domain-containing protein, partial [Edaphobacter sp.]
HIATDTFTNPEGTVIHYKRASLTHEGKMLASTDPLDLLLKDVAPVAKKSRSGSRSTSANARALGTNPRASRKIAAEAEESAYTSEQKELEATLRAWRKAEAAKTGKPAFIVFSDAILHAIVQTRPRTIPNLLQISGIGPEKADRYGAAICALCNSRPVPGEFGATSGPLARPTSMKAKPKSAPRPATTVEPAEDHAVLPAETFRRERTTVADPSEGLTPDQRSLDQRLRDWRKAESEKLGLPLFFVLSTTTLRSIVLLRPKTIAQLKSIAGLGQEKIEKFGPSIIQACTT